MADTTMHDLRGVAETGGYPDIPTLLMQTAADEIERLTAERDRLRDALKAFTAAMDMPFGREYAAAMCRADDEARAAVASIKDADHD